MRGLSLAEVVFTQQIEIGRRRRAIPPQMDCAGRAGEESFIFGAVARSRSVNTLSPRFGASKPACKCGAAVLR
jgi:hypothetical protein